MTGPIGSLHMLVVAAITAGGVMLAQAEFNGGSFDAGSKAGAGTKARLSADEGGARVSADAEASVEADAGIETSNECVVACPAPCATGCAPEASLSAEGAAGSEAAFRAAVAPEHSCDCPEAGEAPETEGGAGAGFDSGATFEGEGALTAALTSKANGSITFGVD